jgi:nitrogen fixation NifU-like protein
MSDELYHAELVARAHAGRKRGRLRAPDRSITLDNPLCGDRVTLDLCLSDARVTTVGHQVRGCLLCEAAAETIGTHAPGKSAAELAAVTRALSAVVRDGALPPEGEWSCLAAFAPVHQVKSRRDCVMLPFEALGKALAESR